jgi:capsular exopolysaccharide synthesis family protein
MGVVNPPVHSPDTRTIEDYPLESPAHSGRVAEADAPVVRPVVASPRPESPRPVAHFHPASDEKLVISPVCNRVSVEQYRRLAASLHEAQIARGLKAVVVTSAVPKEGKTLTAVNLALTFSESYERRVLLIDADFHRRSVHELLGIPNERGLGEALRSGRLDPCTTPYSSRLTILTAGEPEPNPLAGLSSVRMGELLAEAASLYDWVIVDTPPLAVLSDAQLLVRLTQAALFVVRAGSTPFAVVNKAIEELGREHIVGTVLNGVDDSAVAGASYYGHYEEHGRLTAR